MVITLRNRFNHFLLNKLLVMRFRCRKHPLLTRAVLNTEKICIRTGLIFRGRTPANGTGGHSGAPDSPRGKALDSTTFIREN